MPLICLNLSTSQLVTHPMPSGERGIVRFENEEEIEAFRQTLPAPHILKSVKLSKREMKQIPHQIGW